MNINLLAVLVLALAHWLGDFVAQSDKIATTKSKSNHALLEHTLIYSAVLGAASFLFLGFTKAIIFGLITLLIHTVTDYFTSRLNSRLYASGQIHNFFVSIGFDQFLHLLQLLITFQLLS